MTSRRAKNALTTTSALSPAPDHEDIVSAATTAATQPGQKHETPTPCQQPTVPVPPTTGPPEPKKRGRPPGRSALPPGTLPVSAVLADASKISGVGRTRLYELLSDGAVPSVVACGRRLVNVPALLQWVAQPAHRVLPGDRSDPSSPCSALPKAAEPKFSTSNIET